MKNVAVTKEKDTLVIRVNLKEKGEPSGSGKTLVIATTHGNVQVEGVTVGLNVYIKNPEYTKPGK